MDNKADRYILAAMIFLIFLEVTDYNILQGLLFFILASAFVLMAKEK